MIRVRARRTFVRDKKVSRGEEAEVPVGYARRNQHLVRPVETQVAEGMGQPLKGADETQEEQPEEFKDGGVTVGYVCPHCDRRFKNKAGLSSHLRAKGGCGDESD